ncbi:hypothetical protein R1sor_004918 [Riccia sorocarpa]|uniref:Peptidase A1 domain-containing protein n=1 Tax=Riccia sorocarpa TaxID=122646 RepID=A0ABD3HL07_9MARC
MAALAIVTIVLLLLVQSYSCAALRNQQTAWVTNHLYRSKSLGLHSDRKVRKLLGEATGGPGAHETRVSKGVRGSLIRSTYKAKTEKLTIFEKIRHDVEMSKKRAMYLSSQIRKTTNEPIQKRKLLENFESEIDITPGEYSMEISIGTPPQTFVGVADTGSDLVWVQCSKCNPCFNSSANFDPSLSSTYQQLGCGASCDKLGESNILVCDPTCQYTYSYGDNSTTVGDFSSETVWTKDGAGRDLNISNFLFGCGLGNAGLYEEINGLVGLGRGPLSFPSQIAPNLDNNNKFSYCFVLNTNANDTSPILFGADAVPTGTISTTPISSIADFVSTFYFVNLNDISVGGSPLSIPSTSFQFNNATEDGGVIFDSGTTYTNLESVAYKLVVVAFIDEIQYDSVNLVDLTGLDLCFSVPSFDNLTVPEITFNFEGADFQLTIENIVQKVTDDSGKNFICLAITEGPAGSTSIIGNWQQQNFQVLYDLDNKHCSGPPVP